MWVHTVVYAQEEVGLISIGEHARGVLEADDTVEGPFPVLRLPGRLGVIEDDSPGRVEGAEENAVANLGLDVRLAPPRRRGYLSRLNRQDSGREQG
jgi:hypothetical protein